MNVCCSLIRVFVILLNIIFWLVGIAMVGLGVWMLTDPTFVISMTQEQSHYYYALYIFLTVGVLMVIVAFFGCCGAFKESSCMLVSFFCCMLIVLTAEIAAGVWSLQNGNKFETFVRSNVKHSISQEYGVLPSRTVAIDGFQSHFECCGADGPSDWSNSKFNGITKNNVMDLAISTLKIAYAVPESCCKLGTDKMICETSRKGSLTTSINPVINRTGCMEKLVVEVKQNFELITFIGIGIVSVQIFGLILALFLCCAIRRKDEHYKD
ncbi:unnamed protein product [Diamesa hyperborea]